MNRLNDDYFEKTKPDIKDSVPQKGLKRWLFLFSNHFFRLMEFNLLFLILCLPIVTIPAAIIALTRVLRNLYTTGVWDNLAEFFQEFRCRFLPRLGCFFIPAIVPLSVFLWGLRLGVSSLAAGACLALVPFCAVTLCYFTVIEGMPQSHRALDSLKQALGAVFRYPKCSLQILLVPVLLYTAALFTLPYSLIAMAFLLFAAGQLALCGHLSSYCFTDPAVMPSIKDR